MRVIAGTSRGAKLDTTEGLGVRPTIDRVKEAIFSSIHFELPGSKVLDLFAGSGQLGIEALSRGASQCVFIEHDRAAHAMVQKNLNTAGLMKHARVAQMDALSFLQRLNEPFDFVFMDPPYDCTTYAQMIELLAPFLNEGGKIIVEHLKEAQLPQEVDTLVRKKSKKYGKTLITVYQKEGELL